MIPVLACVLYNRRDLLERMLASVDVEVDTLLIVSTGGVDLSGVGIATDISTLEIQYCANIGCSGGWNRVMDHTFNERGLPYVLIVGNDIVWSPGDLQRMTQTVDDFPDADFVFGNHSYSNFIVKRSGWEKIGAFDENFEMAYCEDGDAFTRVRFSGAKAIHATGLHATHEGSATIKSDAALSRVVKAQQAKNWAYYSRKWNCPVNSGGQEKMPPFGDPNHPINRWSIEGDRLNRPYYFTHNPVCP